MRATYNGFLINGKPILTPDQDIVLEFSDLDSDETGRDESGVMHRIVLRRGVKKWSIPYKTLTREEYVYMESLFAGADEFRVTYTEPSSGVCKAYRSNHSVTVRNSLTGEYRNYNLSIIEC